MTITYTSPQQCLTIVNFNLTNPFIANGTGGGDCTIAQGSVQLTNLVNGDIPTNFTVDIIVNGVIQPNTTYTVVWNSTNYIVTATDLGESTLSAGIKTINIIVTKISTSQTWSMTYNSTSCP